MLSFITKLFFLFCKCSDFILKNKKNLCRQPFFWRQRLKDYSFFLVSSTVPLREGIGTTCRILCPRSLYGFFLSLRQTTAWPKLFCRNSLALCNQCCIRSTPTENNIRRSFPHLRNFGYYCLLFRYKDQNHPKGHTSSRYLSYSRQLGLPKCKAAVFRMRTDMRTTAHPSTRFRHDKTTRQYGYHHDNRFDLRHLLFPLLPFGIMHFRLAPCAFVIIHFLYLVNYPHLKEGDFLPKY